MTYTGEVEVGGPADVQSAGDLRITKLAVGEMSNNAYLLRCELTGEQVLVDAAADGTAVTRSLAHGLVETANDVSGTDRTAGDNFRALRTRAGS